MDPRAARVELAGAIASSPGNSFYKKPKDECVVHVFVHKHEGFQDEFALNVSLSLSLPMQA